MSHSTAPVRGHFVRGSLPVDRVPASDRCCQRTRALTRSPVRRGGVQTAWRANVCSESSPGPTHYESPALRHYKHLPGLPCTGPGCRCSGSTQTPESPTWCCHSPPGPGGKLRVIAHDVPIACAARLPLALVGVSPVPTSRNTRAAPSSGSSGHSFQRE
jgi:hypothetical protein